MSEFAGLPILARASRARSLDYAICTSQDRRRDRYRQTPRGAQVDDELKPRGLFNREISRLGSPEDSIHEDGSAPIPFIDAASIAHETTDLDIVSDAVHRRHAMLCGEIRDSCRVRNEQCVR